MVHQALLCHESPYFRRALDGPFKESQERLFTFEEDDPNIFALFVNWLYGQELADEKREEVCQLPYLWTLADRILVPKLQRDVINVLHRYSVSGSPFLKPFARSSLKPIWDMTTENSKLRKFILTYVATRIQLGNYFCPKVASTLPNGFAEQVLCCIGNFRQVDLCGRESRCQFWRQMNLCDFHEHNGEFPSCDKAPETKENPGPAPKKRKSCL